MNEFFPKVIKKRDGKVAPFNIERIKTAIFKAAYNHEKDCGYAQVVQALVDAGGDVNARIYYGLTPLMLAAGGGEAAVCEVLLKAGAEGIIEYSLNKVI